jgi:tyrosinase
MATSSTVRGKSKAAGKASRYGRVKDILSAAAGDSDYGGLGRFWEKPLEQFLQARLYGVRLVAPAVETCCCGGAPRSESSGLIQGLRGEPPFDGSRFPPLMWGGSRVADDDIDFIAGWIDDGCPAGDGDVRPLEFKSTLLRVTVTDPAEFAVSETGERSYAYREGEPLQRANLDCLTEPQLDTLRDAFRKTYDLNKFEEDRRSYNNQALIHQNHCQHGWERFLPWHRAYIYEFEQNLQDFQPGITVPYWDWTMPQYRPHEPENGWIIPKSFQAFLREDALNDMFEVLKPTPGQEKAFVQMASPKARMSFVTQDDFFCYVINSVGYTNVTPNPKNPRRRAMIDALLASNSLWYPLRYPAQYYGGTINQVIHYHYPTADDIDQILSCNNFRDFGGGNVYNASFGFIDQNPHNTMHIWTGGQNPDHLPPDSFKPAYLCGDKKAAGASPAADEPMLAERRNFTTKIRDRKFHSSEDMYSQPTFGDMFSNLTASYDPVFWPVHSNVDRLWWQWQTQNPTGLPYDLDSILSPWSYTIRDMLDISRFGYEYVRCSYFMPVGMEAPIGRFVSAPITIDGKAKSFKKAEIRMHWVPQLVRSCFVRAFINEPGANAATSVRDNPHYAGYLAIFGHGECYGGPGHCDLPPARPRAFDQRPRSHNAPRNHRLDVTKTARRLLDDGASTLQITLLVIGVDYREENDLLRLEGVSLNLLD